MRIRLPVAVALGLSVIVPTFVRAETALRPPFIVYTERDCYGGTLLVERTGCQALATAKPSGYLRLNVAVVTGDLPNRGGAFALGGFAVAHEIVAPAQQIAYSVVLHMNYAAISSYAYWPLFPRQGTGAWSDVSVDLVHIDCATCTGWGYEPLLNFREGIVEYPDGDVLLEAVLSNCDGQAIPAGRVIIEIEFRAGVYLGFGELLVGDAGNIQQVVDANVMSVTPVVTDGPIRPCTETDANQDA